VRRWVLVGSDSGAEAAFAWLEGLADIEVRRAGSPVEALSLGADGIWVHGPARPAADLVGWLRAGGRLLCTMEAGLLPFALGVEGVAPEVRSDGPWAGPPRAGPLPARLGLAGFGPHPLFAGLHQGAAVWAPTEGERVHRTGYAASRPATGRVVALERSGTAPDPASVVAWEYEVGAGGILCIGAFVVLDAVDPLCRPQLEALLSNAILGDAVPHEGRSAAASSWPAPGTHATAEPAADVPEVPALGAWPIAETSPLDLTGAAGDAPWTFAGRRLVALGDEGGGLREAWAHPFRLVARVRWEEEVGRNEFSAAPTEVARPGADGASAERWNVPVELPALVWDIAGREGRTVSFDVDLRRAWPAPAGAGGDLRFTLRSDGRALRVVDATGAEAVVSIEGGRLAARPGTGPTVEVRAELRGPARIVAIGGVDAADLARTLAALARRGLGGLVAQRRQHAELLRRHGTALRCPEERLGLALEWAKVRMDAHLAGTPGVARSFLAGYAAPDPVRPGRTWYHGPDACWTALGQLATGERDGPRDLLKFLAQSQEVSGRVPHRISTSGFADFGAADATPLFLLLAARYASWTGDLEFLGRWWPAVLRGLHHCLECDADGDGIPENHRQGHDWLRGGPLAASGTSLHLAAVWVAALEGLEPVAEALGFRDLATELADRGVAAREVARLRFRTGDGWAASLDPAGVPDATRTALLALALHLGLVAPEEATAWLDAVAGPGFSTPWGVRLIDRSDPRFSPTDPHAGAVSPLLTGWVSLAEWRAGRHTQALDHARANAALPFERARGAFDEVLHGLEHRAAGNCPDHAAAAALAALPLVTGLWGVVPDALAGAVRVAPWLPPEWDEMGLERLRVGRTSLSFEVRRRPEGLTVRVRRTYGPRIHLALGRAGPPPAGLMVDDVPLGGAVARFDVHAEHEVTFHDA
jgi:hypothetical protein